MHNSHKKYALFIGRWQPFHNGHKYLIDTALSKGEDVCIAIRDTKLSKKDPYTVKQRKEMIRKVYGDNVEIIVIPDIKSINIGRNVGYEVKRIEPPPDIGKISATKIRAGKSKAAPKKVTEYLAMLQSTLWLTGLPCSGKTTLGKILKEEFENRGIRTVHLDGDDIRKTLNADLGFSFEDRRENLRRIAHIARLFNQNQSLVIASFISPTDELRKMIKDIVGNLKLFYLKCSLDTCQSRDIKGMYAKAKKGEIKDFTGISSVFEEPANPDLIVDTETLSPEDCLKNILDSLGLRR